MKEDESGDDENGKTDEAGRNDKEERGTRRMKTQLGRSSMQHASRTR